VQGAEPVADAREYQAESGVSLSQAEGQLRLTWPLDHRRADSQHGVLVLNLQENRPLIAEMGYSKSLQQAATPLVRGLDPVTFLTVGSRDLKEGWDIFFDNPPRRAHETFRAMLAGRSARTVSRGKGTTVIFDGLSAGPFRGDLRFTLYSGAPLVHVEAVLSTERDACAILYDTGLVSASPDWRGLAWLDVNDRWQRSPAADVAAAATVGVRSRTILAECAAGTLAVFPPPHQFLYPLDFADNFQLAWHGKGYREAALPAGFGVRQPPEGDKRYVPWVNAPPRTQQRLGVFYLLSPQPPEQALEEVRAFTHGDRFVRLPGHRTFTSHFHVEHVLDLVQKQQGYTAENVPADLVEPAFVKSLKAHGADIVHLAEFHVRHTPELTANRLKLLAALHRECRRLSSDEFLLLPGEEPNVHLGGHWISFFPRPVYWELHPAADTPFERQVEGVGKVYAVHNAAEVLRLMEQEQGLMWTAHPRIKSSYGFPDRYRDQPFYQSDRYLGGAWKAMPADLSQPRLGRRVLDLFNDMNNWGQHKQVLGEVDVFKIYPTSELYGHMNINYLKLDKLPRFDDGWASVLEALRGGRYFVSTGEVLLPEFDVGGKVSGQTLKAPADAAEQVVVRAKVQWTFPPAFAEIVWGDGRTVHRKEIDLRGYQAFSQCEVQERVPLAGARWVRLEAWDVAANGAFTQPVWIE
jgi:hypothetical protein